MNIASNGDISFYEDTGTTPKFFWDASAERLGIGTSSPTQALEVNGAILIKDSTSVGTLLLTNTSVGIKRSNAVDTVNSRDIEVFTDGSGANVVFSTNGAGSAEMIVSDSGNVGIGTTSPSNYNSAMNDLVVAGSGDSGITIASGTSSEGSIAFADGTSGGDAYRGWINYNHNSNFMRFSTNATERMRLDSSGNLLVGKTSVSLSTTGFYTLAGGATGVTRSASTPMAINRLSNDGSILEFYKNSSIVGSIGVEDGDNLVIACTASNHAGLKFNNTAMAAYVNGASSDNTMAVGTAVVRFKDIYATNGTIQTSDRNEKQDIEALSDAEQRVAVACKGLLRKFRWIDAVAEKGDDARIHFGIIAQDLQDAFAAEGLDAGRYAMFISSTWWEATETYTDDDGVEQTRVNTYETAEEAPEGATERTRLGVRYPELLAFIIAAI
jgi:hypothetical protein